VGKSHLPMNGEEQFQNPPLPGELIGRGLAGSVEQTFRSKGGEKASLRGQRRTYEYR